MDLREHLSEAVSEIPVVDAGRCVHTHAEVASCERCVSVCPRRAWVLDDDALAIDTSRCDACGLCVAHCPQGALSQPGSQLAAYAGQETISLSCERTAGVPGACRVSCINAVGLAPIASLYKDGLRHLYLDTADCRACPRTDPEGLLSRLAAFNCVLSSRGLADIAVSAAADQPAGRKRNERVFPGTALSRRGFFRRLAGVAVEATSPERGWRLAGRFLPAAAPGDRVLWTPRIDPTRCNGCDACIRICPQDALVLADDTTGYRIHADACTGCGLCTDVCDRDAVEVGENVELEQSYVALGQGTCRACGAAFHRPADGRGAGNLCHVCTQVNHRRHLYQVL